MFSLEEEVTPPYVLTSCTQRTLINNARRSTSLLAVVAAVAVWCATVPASISATPTTPQVLSMALDAEPPQLDSTRATDTISGFILGHIMEGLTRAGKDGKPLPGVAEKWKVTDKGAEFTLRKDAKWSDGKPVTAKDFIFAWQKLLDPATASEYAFLHYPIKNAEAINKGKMPVTALGVKAEGDHVLKVEFEKPCGFFVSLTAFQSYLPVREDFYNGTAGKYGADANQLMFNGAFKLTKWVHGAEMSFEKNEFYWDRKSVALDRIEIPYITNDNSARFNFFKDKKVDLVDKLNKDDLAKAQGQNFKIRSFGDGSIWYLEYNFREGRITRNKALRQAMKLVFNQEEFVTKVIGVPGTRPGRSLIPTWVPGAKEVFRKEYPVVPTKLNLAEAKKLIDQAKKELGVPQIPAMVLLVDDTPLGAKIGEYFQSLYKTTLGLELKIDKQIFKLRLAKMTAGDFDIVNAGWGPDFADPLTFAEVKASWNENNRGKYSNPQYDELIRAAQNTADQKVRMDSMAAAEKLALDEVAILPTYERTIAYLQSDRVDGIIRHAIGADPDFTRAKIVKK